MFAAGTTRAGIPIRAAVDTPEQPNASGPLRYFGQIHPFLMRRRDHIVACIAR